MLRLPLDTVFADAALLQTQQAVAQSAQQTSFGQPWAMVFMAVVNAWLEQWAGPRIKAAQHWRATTLDLLQSLTVDDDAVPTLSFLPMHRTAHRR